MRFFYLVLDVSFFISIITMDSLKIRFSSFNGPKYCSSMFCYWSSKNYFVIMVISSRIFSFLTCSAIFNNPWLLETGLKHETCWIRSLRLLLLIFLLSEMTLLIKSVSLSCVICYILIGVMTISLWVDSNFFLTNRILSLYSFISLLTSRIDISPSSVSISSNFLFSFRYLSSSYSLSKTVFVSLINFYNVIFLFWSIRQSATSWIILNTFLYSSWWTSAF